MLRICLTETSFLAHKVLNIVSFWQICPIRVSEINLCRWVLVCWCFGSSDQCHFRIDLCSQSVFKASLKVSEYSVQLWFGYICSEKNIQFLCFEYYILLATK